MIRSTPVFKFLISLVFLAAAWPTGAVAGTPSAVVEGFHGNLLAVMKEADTLGVKGRYQRLESPVASAFDLQRTIRIGSNRSGPLTKIPKPFQNWNVKECTDVK